VLFATPQPLQSPLRARFNAFTLNAHMGFNRPTTYFKQPLPIRRPMMVNGRRSPTHST
jgi:hypothetical protein